MSTMIERIERAGAKVANLPSDRYHRAREWALRLAEALCEQWDCHGRDDLRHDAVADDLLVYAVQRLELAEEPGERLSEAQYAYSQDAPAIHRCGISCYRNGDV